MKYMCALTLEIYEKKNYIEIKEMAEIEISNH